MKRNNIGFSLVELLAVVVILGLLAAIGIVATSSLIDRSKQDKMDSQKNTVTMSAQTYMQNNKNLVPKIIGESSIIKVSDLRASNYLTEDIKNNKGESCMEKSYVRVYKLSNSEYTYTTFLYCGSEEVPAEEVVPSPTITAKFSDSTGEIKDEILNNVSDAYLYIEMSAASETELQNLKNQGTDIYIDGYTFKIFVTKDGQKQEAYNSGSLSGGNESKIIINKKLNDYIDVTGITQVSLEVTAINSIGGITNTNTTIGESGEVSSSTYDDNVKPKCIKPESPYSEDDWLNKEVYNTTKLQRKLTVGCDDGTGSGCIRNNFTMSWPNDDDQYGAEFVYIKVKDNAGNVSDENEECRFRVNVDIKAPEATVTAFTGAASSANTTQILSTKLNGTNILSKSFSVSDKKATTSIETTDYKNLVAESTEVKWMNNEKYPNGVIYKIELKDNIRLDKWTWQTNAGYINDTKNSKYLTVNLKNPEASSGSITQDEAHGMTILHGSTHDTVYVRFYTEGMRYGVFTAYDKAGNEIQIKIAANLDRTPPPVPSNLIAYLYNKERTSGTKVSKSSYSFGTWTNRYVRVQTAGGQSRDDLTNGVTLSGFWEFRYDARNYANKRVGSGGTYSTNSLGIGMYDFKGTASEVDGKNKIRFMGCDKAGNCSDWGAYKDVWIDITIPTCSVAKSITNGAESSYNWLGIGETARVTATCNDPTTTQASGCTVSSFYHDYNYQINTTTAGADGNNKGGTFTDAAGNSVTCAADKRIQIDYEAPKCTVSGGNAAWTNKSRTVTGTCSDTGGSGCRGNISHTYNYNTATTQGGAVGVGNGGSVGDKADNYTSCAANQKVYVDVVNPYIIWDPSSSSHNKDTSGGGQMSINATCKDAFSGFEPKHPTYYYSSAPIPTTSSGKTFEKCCTDKAGNTYCETKTYYVKHLHEDSSCGVKLYKECRTSGCGVELYKSCRTSACGVASYKSCKNSACGSAVDYYICRGWSSGAVLYTCMPKCGNCPSGYWEAHYGYKTCRTSGCGVESYNSCRNSACGVERYNLCRHSQCGVQEYKTCYHYRSCDNLS